MFWDEPATSTHSSLQTRSTKRNTKIHRKHKFPTESRMENSEKVSNLLVSCECQRVLRSSAPFEESAAPNSHFRLVHARLPTLSKLPIPVPAQDELRATIIFAKAITVQNPSPNFSPKNVRHWTDFWLVERVLRDDGWVKIENPQSVAGTAKFRAGKFASKKFLLMPLFSVFGMFFLR